MKIYFSTMESTVDLPSIVKELTKLFVVSYLSSNNWFRILIVSLVHLFAEFLKTQTIINNQAGMSLLKI